MRKITIFGAGAVLALGAGALALHAVPGNNPLLNNVVPQAAAEGTSVFTMAMPASSAVENADYQGDSYFYMSRITWSYTDMSLKVNKACEYPVLMTLDGKQIGAVSASASSQIMLLEPMEWEGDVFPGELGISFETDINDAEKMASFKKAGTYEVTFPAGFFKLGNEEVGSFSFTYNVKTGVSDEPAEFKYTLTPNPAETTKSLSQITLKFEDVSYIDFSSTPSLIATLESEDGSLKLTSGYPTSNFVNEIVIPFGNQETEWVDGKYTLTVNPGTINLNDDNWDEGLHPGNFQGLKAEFNLKYEAPKPAPKLSDHISLYLPSNFDANKNNTRDFGMEMVVFGLNVTDTEMVAAKEADWIYMNYYAPGSEEPELMCSFAPDNELQVSITGIGAMDDNDSLIEFPAQTYLQLHFNYYEDDEIYGDFHKESALYKRDGRYEIVIPNGAFLLNDEKMEGVTLNFNYSASEPEVDFTYTLNPADGAAVGILESADDKNVIRFGINFPNATNIDYKGNGGGVLKDPEGVNVSSQYPEIDYDTKTITYKFGGSKTTWKEGQYTFQIKKNYIAVNLGFLDTGDEGNFPGLTATYIFSKSTSGVALIGIEAADSYDVYTLDGRLVSKGLAPEEMGTLENGLYIINGQKVLLRK